MLTDPAEADPKRASRFRVMVSEGEARASFSLLEMLPTSAGVRRCSSASGDVAGRFREAVPPVHSPVQSPWSRFYNDPSPPTSTSRPPDVTHVINETRPSPFFALFRFRVLY